MVDKNVFEQLKATIAQMDTINTAINDTHDITPARALEPVLGDIDYEDLGQATKAKLADLVDNYLIHVRAALEGEMDNKSLEIQKLRSNDR